MRKLITLATIAVFALTLSAGSFAQAKPGTATGPAHHGGKKHGQKGGHGVLAGKVADKLNLSQEQRARIKALNDQFRSQVKAMRTSGTDKQLNREKFKAMAKAHRESVMNVLNDSQKAQLKAIKAEHKRNHKGDKRTNKTKKNVPPTV